MYCLYPPLHTVPSGTWLCPHCDQVSTYTTHSLVPTSAPPSQKRLIVKLKVLLLEAKEAKLKHKASKDRLRRKVDRYYK